jgi:hypothetical protein
MAASGSGVRPASAQDAPACLAIYRPYVQTTAISWEIDVPTVADMAARIDGLRATHEWLVLERDDQIVGFAYGQPLKRLAPSNGRRRPSPRWRRTRALHAAAAPAHRAIIDPSGSRTPAYTDAPHGSATAGTTWPGCNSICWTLLIRMDRPARFADRGRRHPGR